MKDRYLVLFSVGPVQSFIASARKTEDYWSGSFLLSHLIREALRGLYQEEGFELVFPVVSKEEIEHPDRRTLHIASLPNRFTAVMKGTEETVIKRLKATEQQIRESFYDVCDTGIRRLFVSLAEEKQLRLLKTAHAQIDAFLEMYWVIEPYENDADFKEVQERLESRLGALKNEKHYPQVEQHGLTCSVCHERDALSVEPMTEGDRYGDMKRKLYATWNRRDARFKASPQSNENEDGPQRIKDHEFLCGICTGKRLARDYFANFYQHPPGFKGFQSVVEIAGDKAYYGILMMDGDNMGARLSEADRADFMRISENLAKFAMKTVPKIVEEEFSGRLIYAGGDDVLAFLPVDEALEAAERLRFAFSSETEGLGEGATASVGLIIGYKKAPMQGLLGEVRKLEGKAKKYRHPAGNMTKNALALAVHTNSGEIKEVVFPWNIGDKQTAGVLRNFINLLKEDLSPTFINHFTDAFAPLISPADEKYRKIMSREIVETELRRLIIRSLNIKQSGKKADMDKIVAELLILHDCMPTTLEFLLLLRMLTFFEEKEREQWQP